MKTKKDVRVLGIIVAILLVIGAVADLSISNFLYNPQSLFGKTFEIIGEFPASFIASLCVMIIAVFQKKWNWKRIIGMVFAVLFSVMGGFMLIAYWDGSEALGLVCAVLIFLLDFFFAKKICAQENPNAYKAAKLGIKLFVSVLLLFNFIKLGWGRERYRHMVASGDFSGFSPWFIPQGLASGNEFMSFPSGHSANASITIWITLLPAFVPALKDKEKVLKICAVIWIGCVMLSRIIMGAHFLSDVTVGMAISLILFYVFYKRECWKNEI